MTITGRLGATYAPLRVPAYRAFLGAQTVSTIGSLIQSTALAWITYEITRSPASLGLIATLSILPMVALGPIAGTLADRFDRRGVLVATQLSLAVLAGTLAILVQTGTVQIWHLYLLAVVTGAITALDAPALQAYAGDLVGTKHVRQAVTLGMMGFQVSRTLGPPLAGILVTVADAASAFWVNAASFLVVAVTIAFLRRTGAAPNAPTVKVDGSTSWEHGTMPEVIGHVRASPILVDLYILPLLYVLGMASSTLYPAFVRDALHADAGALGTIIGAWGAGTFTTSLVLLPLVVTSKRVGLVSAIALAWFGVVLVALGALGLEPVRDAFNKHAGLDAVTVGAMLAFASGVTGPVVLSQSTGLVQAMAPPPMRGRLSGLSGTLNSGVQPFTNLAIGIAGEAVGTPLAMIGNGAVLCGAVAAFVAFRPSVRASFVGFGTMPPQPSPPPLVPRARGGLGPPP